MVGQWAKFNVASLTGVLINDNDVPEDDPTGGAGSFMISPPNVTTEIANIDSITKLSAIDGVLVGDGATTTISIDALDVDLNDNFLLYLVDKTGSKTQGIKLNGSAAKGATSIVVDSFIPRFNFSYGSYIVPSVKSAMLQAPDNLALGVTNSRIYIKPDQFKTWTSSSIQSYTRDSLGSVQPSAYASRTKVFASTFVPAGYKVTGFEVFSSQNRSIQALSSRVSSDNIGSLGTGTANTFQLITAWNSVNGDYFILTYEIGASSDEIYGAELHIELI